MDFIYPEHDMALYQSFITSFFGQALNHVHIKHIIKFISFEVTANKQKHTDKRTDKKTQPCRG